MAKIFRLGYVWEVKNVHHFGGTLIDKVNEENSLPVDKQVLLSKVTYNWIMAWIVYLSLVQE